VVEEQLVEMTVTSKKKKVPEVEVAIGELITPTPEEHTIELESSAVDIDVSQETPKQSIDLESKGVKKVKKTKKKGKLEQKEGDSKEEMPKEEDLVPSGVAPTLIEEVEKAQVEELPLVDTVEVLEE